MNLAAYQRSVMQGMHVAEGVDQITHAALGLTAEAGEVADVVKQGQYVNGALYVDHLLDELGDTLWYLTFLAGSYGFSLSEIAQLNHEKLVARCPDKSPALWGDQSA